jgi:hypothetical protein
LYINTFDILSKFPVFKSNLGALTYSSFILGTKFLTPRES